MKVFAGQRDDAFFVDTGSIFDLGGLRPFNGAHLASRSRAARGVDGVGGFNVNSIAIQVPIQQLTRDRALPTGPNDPDAVLGVWAAVEPQKHTHPAAPTAPSAPAASGSRSRAWAIPSSTR